MHGMPITDVGLAHVKECKNLKNLSLGINISDAGLAHVKELHDLVELRIRCHESTITDAGLAHLKGLMRLQTLALFAGGTRITDVGLNQLGSLKSLETLYLFSDRVTKRGWPTSARSNRGENTELCGGLMQHCSPRQKRTGHSSVWSIMYRAEFRKR